MFCSKCGYEFSEGSFFCGNCGEKLSSEKTIIQAESGKEPLPITEYFEKECSIQATKRQLLLKRFLLASSIIQFSLLLLAPLVNIHLLFFPGFLLYLVFRIFLGAGFAVGAVLLTKKGIKKKSPGRLFASMLLAFLSACVGTNIAINMPTINISIAIIVVLIHIIMLVINSKDVNEYKEYLLK